MHFSVSCNYVAIKLAFFSPAVKHDELPSQMTLNLWNFVANLFVKRNPSSYRIRAGEVTWSTAVANHIIQLASRDLARRQHVELKRDTPPFWKPNCGSVDTNNNTTANATKVNRTSLLLRSLLLQAEAEMEELHAHAVTVGPHLT